MLVTDKRMLGLDLQELGSGDVSALVDTKRNYEIRTEAVILASSSVFRMRSLPPRGTWVSCVAERKRLVREIAIKIQYDLTCLPNIITNSPFPFKSPFWTRSSVSSFLPFPSEVLCMSVAKKQTEERTRWSNAASWYQKP
jgi:hypothetical protein